MAFTYVSARGVKVNVPPVPPLVGVGEGLLVGVRVAVAVKVTVAVGVRVWVAVGVRVSVAVGVRVWVAVGPLVGVRVAVGVDVKVAVGTDPPPVSMINCGALAPAWRLARLIAVLPGVVRDRLKTPLPVMYEVTSIVFQVPAPTAPDEPSTLPTAGALL